MKMITQILVLNGNGRITCGVVAQNLPSLGSSKSCYCSSRGWSRLACDDTLWFDLFHHRWRSETSKFLSLPTASWKHIYQVQDRCHRYGTGLKIVREGTDYFLINQGQIQRCLGSAPIKRSRVNSSINANAEVDGEQKNHDTNIADTILFLIGDLETATAKVSCSSANSKRIRRL
ncbi:hypothetical protein ZOSMA_246G00160 [Zostera marina]|uniref:Uncharacterized protein n=1 Tax=Zostera marina TaxID=29655 RepID=A0A0K9PGX4_ZOSMR|nr:hypothetical protein ZOSMA_246G00160 [Zostera marina]